jgi:hypothetical protein
MKIFSILLTLFLAVNVNAQDGSEKAPVIESVRFLQLDGRTEITGQKNPAKYEPTVIEVKLSNYDVYFGSAQIDLAMNWSLTGEMCMETVGPDGKFAWVCQPGTTESTYVEFNRSTSQLGGAGFEGKGWKAILTENGYKTATYLIVIYPEWNGRTNKADRPSVESFSIESAVIKEKGQEDVEVDYSNNPAASKSVSVAPLAN